VKKLEQLVLIIGGGLIIGDGASCTAHPLVRLVICGMGAIMIHTNCYSLAVI